MNTLSRAITAQFFTGPQNYYRLEAHWSHLVNSPRQRDLDSSHYLLYQILRGKDWRKAFTPITRRTRLENGGFNNWGLFQALSVLHSPSWEAKLLEPFGGLVSPEALRLVRTLVPIISINRYDPSEFRPGAFPFQAYAVPASLLASTSSQENAHA